MSASSRFRPRISRLRAHQLRQIADWVACGLTALTLMILFGGCSRSTGVPTGAGDVGFGRGVVTGGSGSGSDASGPGGGGSDNNSNDNPIGVTLDAEETAFLALINDYRATKGFAALKVSVSLTQAAQWLSTDMATRDYFSHTDSDGRSYSSRIEDFGYPTHVSSGENIAAGNSTAQATFTQWKNSSGHNANMLGSGYKVIGIGRAYDAGSAYGWYWTTDFGGVE